MGLEDSIGWGETGTGLTDAFAAADAGEGAGLVGEVLVDGCCRDVWIVENELCLCLVGRFVG